MLSLSSVAQLGVGAAILGGLFYILYPNGNTKPLLAIRLSSGGSEESAATVDAKQGARNEPDTQDKSVESSEGGVAVVTAREAATPAQAWDKLMAHSALARDSIANIEWPSFPDNIPELLVPEWARLLPVHVSKLKREISMEPDSLAHEIWQESEDPGLNPEILWSATVRVSNDLCDEEKAFLKKRKEFTRTALAKYLGLPDEEVHPDDVPIIAACGSGGGLRAVVAGTGSYLAATEAGLFDCVTYTAGVSGSCWLQTLYHSSLAGRNFEKLVGHLKARLGVHIAFPPAALTLLNTAPTNKYLLRGLVEQLKGDPDGERGLVDIYGLLLAARLLVPRGELDVRDIDLKVSSQRVHVDTGLAPMPIYAAVRHEIPLDTIADTGSLSSTSPDGIKEKAKEEAWFQWFEFSPYEMWCEELEAGIPAWAIGRQFQDGKNVLRENGLGLPERRLPSLMGIWGSAFCATLRYVF
jgi:cytosolic phospholipase A2